MLDMLMIDSGFLCIHGSIRPAFGPLFSLRVLNLISISSIRLSNNNILFSSSYSSFLNESVTLFLCKVYEAKLDIFFESLRNREPKHYLNMD